jgi:hypothetical protein
MDKYQQKKIWAKLKLRRIVVFAIIIHKEERLCTLKRRLCWYS